MKADKSDKPLQKEIRELTNQLETIVNEAEAVDRGGRVRRASSRGFGAPPGERGVGERK